MQIHFIWKALIRLKVWQISEWITTSPFHESDLPCLRVFNLCVIEPEPLHWIRDDMFVELSAFRFDLREGDVRSAYYDALQRRFVGLAICSINPMGNIYIVEYVMPCVGVYLLRACANNTGAHGCPGQSQSSPGIIEYTHKYLSISPGNIYMKRNFSMGKPAEWWAVRYYWELDRWAWVEGIVSVVWQYPKCLAPGNEAFSCWIAKLNKVRKILHYQLSALLRSGTW